MDRLLAFARGSFVKILGWFAAISKFLAGIATALVAYVALYVAYSTGYIWVVAILIFTLAVVYLYQCRKKKAKVQDHKGLWVEMAWYGKFLTMFFHEVRFGLPSILSIAAFGAIEKLDIHVFFSIMAAFCVIGVYVILYLEKLPAENEDGKPVIGLPTFLEARLARALGTGWFLSMPGLKVIPFVSEKINKDVEFPGIRCRLDRIEAGGDNGLERVAKALYYSGADIPESGGEVDITVAFTVQPSATPGVSWALLALDQAGETEGAIDILIDSTEEDVRQDGRHLTWLQAEFAGDLWTAWLIARATGMYEFEGRHILKDVTDQRIRDYLKHVRINGVPDEKALGLRITRLNIKRAKAVGELATAAKQAAVEKLRRIAQKENTKTLIANVNLALTELPGDHGLNAREIIDRIQVDEEGSRVSKTINQIDIPDAEAIAGAVVKVLGGMKK